MCNRNAQQQIDSFVENTAEKNSLIKKLQIQIIASDNSYVNDTLGNFDTLTDKDWRAFKMSFETLNPNFLDRLKLKIPQIRQGEQRIILLANLDLGLTKWRMQQVFLPKP